MIETLSDIFTSSIGVIFKAVMIVILASLLAGFLVIAYKGIKILICKIRNYVKRMKVTSGAKLNLYIDKVAEAIVSRHEKLIQKNYGFDTDNKDRREKIDGLWVSTCGRFYIIISENGFYYSISFHDSKTGREEHGILRNMYESREKYLYLFDGLGYYTIGYNPILKDLYLAQLNIRFKRKESSTWPDNDEPLKSDDVFFEDPSSSNGNSNPPDLSTLQQKTDEVYKRVQEVYKDLKESISKKLNDKDGTESNDKKSS